MVQYSKIVRQIFLGGVGSLVLCFPPEPIWRLYWGSSTFELRGDFLGQGGFCVDLRKAQRWSNEPDIGRGVSALAAIALVSADRLQRI